MTMDYSKCKNSPDGKHHPHWPSMQFCDELLTDNGDTAEIVIDVVCKYCEVSGSFKIEVSEVFWD